MHMIQFMIVSALHRYNVIAWHMLATYDDIGPFLLSNTNSVTA